MHALPSSAAPSPMLVRCLLLAALLHLWLLLLLGNAPGGTARQGEGVWGAINITLRGPETKGAAEVAVPEAPNGPPGTAALPRFGGTVRQATPPVPPEPGAAQLGEWAARQQAVPAPAAPPTPVVPAAAAPPVPPAPPPPPGRVLEERPAPPPPMITPAPETTAAPQPVPAPAAEAQPVERNLSSSLSRDAAALRPVAPLEAPAPAPLARPLALPQRLPEMAPALPIPASPVPLAPVAATAPAPALAAPEEALLRHLAAPPAPAAAAPVEALPRSQPLAPAVQPTLSPVPLVPSAAAVPAAGNAPGSTPAAPAPGPASTPGTPEAGSRVGADVATPPSAAASTPPRLNLELARPRGGELSRRAGLGALPLLPRPPELPDKLGREIEKAAKPDCRTAHAGAGLLAVVPLAADALRKEGGCKW